MRLNVLALDYDGTIARDGQLDRNAAQAIADARAAGVTVVLVTGRILDDLRSVAGNLDFVDGIVGENGAVLVLPNGFSRVFGPAPPPAFVEELRRRGVKIRVGQCIVEMDASGAPHALDVIRKLELPLALLFNRGRLMVLPQSISKGTGLQEALNALSLSPHNAIGIGDAENDHDLLAACEFGLAAGWGSPALQAAADAIIPGIGPDAISPYVHGLLREMRIPRERLSRSRLTLGVREDGSPLGMAIRNRNIVIAGETRSGKSWVNGLACEQLILQGYSVCVIDAEGDYRTLDTLPGVVVLGGQDSAPDLPDLTRVLRQPHMSVIVDLSHLPHPDKSDYVSTLLPMLATLRKTTGLPHRIVLEEAHYFLHGPNVVELMDLDLGAYTLVTYRLSDLHPDIRAAIDGVILKRTTDSQEIAALREIAGIQQQDPTWENMLRQLDVGEAILLPSAEEAEGKPVRFRLLPRLTPHVRHKTKYVDVELPADHGFAFTDKGRPIGSPVRTLKSFVDAIQTMPLEVLAGHAERGDFSRWAAEVFHDHVLAGALQKVERRHILGHMQHLPSALGYSIEERYDLPPPPRPERAGAVAGRR